MAPSTVFQVDSGHPVNTLADMPSRAPEAEPPYSTDRSALERESVVTFVRASGPGGQHRNKRETGIRLVHPKSGVEIVATERRERERNRDLAFERLIERIKALNFVPTKRRPTRIPRREKRRRLTGKRRAAERRDDRKIPTS
ncbi:MAG: ribosome-associated protein [Myxococcota bacterium]